MGMCTGTLGRGAALVFGPALSTDTDLCFSDQDILAGSPDRIFCRLEQAETAGDFHEGNGHAFNGIGLEDLGQFFFVVLNIVKFWTADHHRLFLEETPVEVRVGKGNAIGRHQEVGFLKIGGIHWHQF